MYLSVITSIMTKIHVISDLEYWINEFADPIEGELPDCDLVIVNGNLGQFRRSMLYTEGMCQKYPNGTFIYNPGRREAARQKNRHELTAALTTRQKMSELWPKNLKYGFEKPIELNINNENFSILCMFGYPKITEKVETSVWHNTQWYKEVNLGHRHDQAAYKPVGSADLYHGSYPLWTTPEMCSEEHDKEQVIVKEWMNTCPDKKILITHLNPVNDPCLTGVNYQLYPDINHTEACWISAGLVNDDALNYSNAGRGESVRNRVLEI